MPECRSCSYGKLTQAAGALDTSKENMQERLNTLEKMVNYYLDSTKNEILNGDRSNKKVDTSVAGMCFS